MIFANQTISWLDKSFAMVSQFYVNLYKRMFKSVLIDFLLWDGPYYVLGIFSRLCETSRRFVYSSDTRGTVVYLLGLLDSTVVTSGNEPTIETS